MNVCFDIGIALSIILKSLEHGKIGQTIINMTKEWHSFTLENMYECLWVTDQCAQRGALAASSSQMFVL